MTGRTSRRGALFFLAGIGLPALARAQNTPVVPPVATPPLPPATTPATPTPSPAPAAAAPARPAPATPPPAAIDKTKSYYVFFDQAIDVASMRNLRRQLANLVEAGVSEITLVINSPGGLIGPMLITYSFILALPAKISSHAQGFVESAATLLFLAGQERSADRNARFLFHPSQSTINGVLNEQQFRERMNAFDVVMDVTAQIYRDRTHLQNPEIERFAHETVIYTAEQAQAAGVVHTIADLRIPDAGKSKILFLD
jgi:ATP-dependent protease ClpP protease subunit